MADLLDVQNALAALCGTALYPNGTGQPSTAGIDCLIYPGWPEQSRLAKDLGAATPKAHVTIYAPPGMERATTRYARDWQDVTLAAPTITATVSGRVVTIGGSVTPGHYVTMLVDGMAYSYAARYGDTLTAVAAALASLAAGIGATAAGTGVTLPAKYQGLIVARAAAPGTIARELARTQRGFMVTIWAPSPQTRSAIGLVITSALTANDDLDMPDGTAAHTVYRGTNESDGKENAMAYRRDINLWAEYAIIETAPGYPITAVPVTVQGQNGLGDIGTAKTITA